MDLNPYARPFRERAPLLTERDQVRREIAYQKISEAERSIGKRKAICLRGREFSCRVWATRWQRPFGGQDDEGLKFRDVQFLIDGLGGVVGTGLFREWKGPPFLSTDEIFYVLDDLSFEDARLADVIRKAWSTFEHPLNYGAVVEFRSIVVSNRQSGWAEAAQLIMDRFFVRDHSLLLLLAFPLEYENRLPAEDNRARREFGRRQSAMMRWYARKLGVGLMPGFLGKAGWMFRRLGNSCPAPRASRRRTLLRVG